MVGKNLICIKKVLKYMDDVKFLELLSIPYSLLRNHSSMP